MNPACRIAVIDDDPSIQQLLARALQDAGYVVQCADSGLASIELAVAWQPHVILLDMQLPDHDGVTVCSILKARPDTRGVPVIFVTAAADTDELLRAFSAGGSDYITKPFTPREVVARVQVHARLRVTEEELRCKNQRLEEVTAELARLSREDALTQLLNRRSWDEAMAREHERYQRHGQAYCVVMLDVDRFKAYNDARGHQAGDHTLRRVAEALRSAARTTDRVGRYGGEEFVVLAPETTLEAGLKLAERVRKAVWALGIPHPSSPIAGRVTVSLGVAEVAGDSPDDVLKRADDAMYVAKRAGRNMAFAGRSDAPGASRFVVDGAADLPAPATAAGVKVLVVDDESSNRALYRACLSQAGYDVCEAENGAAALVAAKTDPPDVIVMDVMMPQQDGLECTRRLRGAPESHDIPIIMLSALTGNEDILAGLEAGADEYVTKPVRPSELVLRVRSMARLRREHADLLRSYALRGEHMRILTRLVDFCRAVGVSRHLDDIVRSTVAAVVDIARARRVSIMLPDERGRVLVIAGAAGMDGELAEAVRVPVGGPLAGQVFASGDAIVINAPSEAGLRPYGYDSPFFASLPLLCAPLAAGGQVEGVLNVTERIDQRPFEPHELEYIELVGKIAGAAIHDVCAIVAREEASDSIMVALAKLAEHRDNDTGLHLDRVTRFCLRLAETLRGNPAVVGEITPEFLYNLQRAVPLHDIGKVAIPDQILMHPGRLSPEQMAIMRTHTVVGANTIETLIHNAPGVSFLAMAAQIARYHHERWDGAGYPVGLRGHAIPLAARITAIADVYDALTTKRVYKDAFPHDEAVRIIADGAGTQFDPAVVAAFLELEGEFAELAAAMADTAVPAALAGAERDRGNGHPRGAASHR